MQPDNLSKQLEFIKEIDKLKYIQRKTRLFNSDRNENDAEHSWHLALMALVLAEHSNEEVDLLKVLKMVLIHDIVEIDAGDTFLFDAHRDSSKETEQLAAKRIFGMLPEKQADEFMAIWEEFEGGSTVEAKFAHSLDRLEPVLQNDSNQGGTWAEYNVPYEKVIGKVSVMDKGSSVLWGHAEKLIGSFYAEE
ncbi:HD domain-containing protein [Fulvivirga ulvae]|uniref:HD domain-containing protein n=1 Tax=Fulvivirga ulvae TaxID=2904245 RepID=UPI001F453688|nr:HD domain-containing protein [Fulvivirga ulvae]UII32869.1 HD domain-containing protein [Fulvivirga ulvae]